MDDYQWIEGVTAVWSVIDARSRDVEVIYVSNSRYDALTARLQQTARAQGVKVDRVSSEMLSRHVSGDSHGGVIALVGPRRLTPLAELLAIPDTPVLALLDGVEDPYNFGQAVRALYAAGIDGLLVNPRHWLSAAAVVIRASAGATEYMPTAVFNSPASLAQIRAAGFLLAVAVMEDAQPMGEVDLTRRLVLVIGGEKRGASRVIRREADIRVRIPYGRKFDHSLGTAGAAAVLGFEVWRQRQLLRN